ncbi:MAG: SMI1/KNR4 family protein [Flavobacteriales bacterium]|nr:SMI1/KNR4 family protein [Bacteroidota bacterium]MCB9241928.1 SMI1/KNR4 family protein [Flavobacteriales bacterium]
MFFKKKSYDPNDLAAVESALNISLPAFVHDFYAHESALIQKLRKMANDEDYIYLTTDFDWMIEHNRDFLNLPNTEGFCRGKLCIGTDGCGNDTFISLSGDDPRVFCLDMDTTAELMDEATNDFRWEDDALIKHDSLKHYVEDRITMLKEMG